MGRLVVIALAALLVAGCAGATPAEPGGPTGTASDGPPPGLVGVRNAAVTVACSNEGLSGPWSFTIAATDASSGAPVRELRFTLPKGTEPAFPCADGRGNVASAGLVPSYAFRQVFDADFRKIAVTSSDARTSGRRVGVLDIATGQVTDLSPARSDFAAAPQDHSAVFADDGRVWFASDTTRTVTSVAPDGSGLRDEGPTGYTNGVAMLGSGDLGLVVAPRSHTAFALAAGGDGFVAPSPDGSVFASVEQAPLTGESGPLELRRSEDDGGSAVPLSGDFGRVERWVDGTRLLGVASAGQGTTITLAELGPGRRAATARSITPATDRYNASPVASPDGSSVMFLSFRANRAALYRVPIGGGEPVVVAPDVATSNYLLEWR
ncbi:TolB family protein [Actinomycetospora termitidis]|uniref:Uncharacterized protein n=1 Tax=Actinomycetospora termitidis TaxID=3053470 RepID=A0ABT7MEA1_9PSEU|nr:hypothetical protein [Actinomycetospora sp. Odt1-22]MDL5158993.1 hypothetical protein [Actinomycetospora sp. Odt1-22]